MNLTARIILFFSGIFGCCTYEKTVKYFNEDAILYFMSYSDELKTKIEKLIRLCNETNTPYMDLLYDNFLSEETSDLYKELLKETKLDMHHLWRALADGIKIDKTKICKHYLWDFAVEEKDNIVLEAFPEINDLIDEDGLIEVPFNADLNKNGFLYKDKYLAIESAISQNFHMIEWLVDTWKNKFTLKLPIDMRRLGLPETRRTAYLASHWQGAKTIINVKNSLGEQEFIIKGNNNIDIPLLDKTEFLFQKRDGVWHLNIEELIPLEGFTYTDKIYFRNVEHRYYTRYIHAITNSDLTLCTHIDGAIRVYNSYENFKLRNSKELREGAVKNLCERYKLFRIDSPDGISEYQEIIGLFFVGNPYVLEFFEGESDFSKDLEKRRGRLLEVDYEYTKFGASN